MCVHCCSFRLRLGHRAELQAAGLRGSCARPRRLASQASGARNEALQPARRECRLHLVLELLARRARGRAASGCRPASCVPAAASPTAVSKSCSIFSAGRTSTRTSASSSPAFAKSCGTPAGTTTTSPGPATIRSRPILNRIVPSTTSKRSSCFGWMCWPPGTRRSGGKLEVDRQQRAVRLCRGLAEGDPLSARGVLECLSCMMPCRSNPVDMHLVQYSALNRTVYDSRRAYSCSIVHRLDDWLVSSADLRPWRRSTPSPRRIRSARHSTSCA